MDRFIKDLIKQGESNRVEFKRRVTSLEKIAKTITAFSNSHGGRLFIGVDDDKRVLGVQPDEERFMLDKAAQFYCRPAIALAVTEEEVDRLTVLVVDIPSSDDKPHECLDKDGNWRIYIRTGDQCQMASDETIRLMRASRPQTSEPLSLNEERLVDYLKSRRRITLKDYAKLINVSKRRAHRILIDMMAKGHIFQLREQARDVYVLE